MLANLPAWGSVMAMAPKQVPAIIFGMYSFCCSGVPYFTMYGITISLCRDNTGAVQLLAHLKTNFLFNFFKPEIDSIHLP